MTPTVPLDLSDPDSILRTFVYLSMVWIGLLVTMLALGVVGCSTMMFVVVLFATGRGTAFRTCGIPKKRPPVLLIFPVTVVGILPVPLHLILIALLLLFMIIRVAKSKCWLFPMIPVIWPTAMMCLTKVSPLLWGL